MEDLLIYYGVDWLAMILTFIAIYYIGEMRWIGLVIMIGGNACWVGMGILTHSVAMVVANVAFAFMNVLALYKWSRLTNTEPASTTVPDA